MTPMRDEWLFGTWDRLRERVQIDADAGPLWLLQPLEERWVEGALVTRLSDDVQLYVHRDRISFGDTSLDRDEVPMRGRSTTWSSQRAASDASTSRYPTRCRPASSPAS